MTEKVSFEYDNTLTTEKGIIALERALASNKIVYIISTRQTSDIYKLADEHGIPHNRVFATGSNEKKVQKILELGITTHFELNAIGKKI
jgi:soluble P-type ATPase